MILGYNFKKRMFRICGDMLDRIYERACGALGNRWTTHQKNVNNSLSV